MTRSNAAIGSIQVLRAVAAIAVVLSHFCAAVDEYATRASLTHTSRIGDVAVSGVDIFFVISGFIIFYTRGNAQLNNGRYQALQFLKRRAIRIYPLYWLLTSVLLILHGLNIALKTHTYTIPYIIASYLLIPYPQTIGNLHPILDQGWTLTFELYFYLIFAIGLIIAPNKKKLGVVVLALLALLAAFSYLFSAPNVVRYIIGSDSLIEFALGGAIVYLLDNINPEILKYGGVILIIGVIALLGNCVFHHTVVYRSVWYGLPAFFIVMGAVFREKYRPVKDTAVYRFFYFLGDASYSIYLTHGFFVITFDALLKKGYLTRIPADVLILAGTISVTLICSIMYLSVERPLMKKLSPQKITK